MADLLGIYENMALLNPLHLLYFVSLFFREEIPCLLNVLCCGQLKCAAAVTGEDAVPDCKPVLVMLEVPLGMSSSRNPTNCGISNSGKCYSKGLVLGGNERFV